MGDGRGLFMLLPVAVLSPNETSSRNTSSGAQYAVHALVIHFRVPGRTVQFYTLLYAKAGVSRPSFWQKMLTSATFSDDLRRPGTSEKTVYETPCPTLFSSGAPNCAKPLENQAACAVGIQPCAARILGPRTTARTCPFHQFISFRKPTSANASSSLRRSKSALCEAGSSRARIVNPPLDDPVRLVSAPRLQYGPHGLLSQVLDFGARSRLH
jgi:hypothetical protein